METANQVTRAIYDAIKSLPPMPHRGRPGRIENTRELVLSSLPYIIVYRVFDERLLILNNVHGAQRWP